MSEQDEPRSVKWDDDTLESIEPDERGEHREPPAYRWTAGEVRAPWDDPPAEPVVDVPPVAPLPPPAATAPPAAPVGWRRLLVVAVVAALVGALAAGGLVFALDDDDESTSAIGGAPVRSVTAAPGTNTKLKEGTPLDLQGVLAKVEPAVVAIGVSGFGGVGAGTGMILTADGEVLTNRHVVEDAAQITVTLNGERESRPADLIAAADDPGLDLALLKIRDASNLPTVELGSSDALRVGDDVIAIGNALALPGGPTVTRGIVSAKDRSFQQFYGLVQTDAAINRGNSGGPLVDATGKVVGINTLVIRGDITEGGAEAIGFAIGIDVIKPVVEDLRAGKGGRANQGFLGVDSQTLDARTKAMLETSVTSGAVVSAVQAGSAAASAGLRRLDIIVKVGDREIRSAADLGAAVRAQAPGTKVTIEYYRGDQKQTTEATLGTRPTSGN